MISKLLTAELAVRNDAQFGVRLWLLGCLQCSFSKGKCLAQQRLGKRAERCGDAVDINHSGYVGGSYTKAVGLTLLPQRFHGGLKIIFIRRTEFAPQFLFDLLVILWSISCNQIDQFVQDHRMIRNPVTDLTGGAYQPG